MKDRSKKKGGDIKRSRNNLKYKYVILKMK